MQLCRNNNIIIIIINATEYKGTIEEKHAHIETPRLIKDQCKPTMGKTLANYSSYICHKMIQQKRV